MGCDQKMLLLANKSETQNRKFGTMDSDSMWRWRGVGIDLAELLRSKTPPKTAGKRWSKPPSLLV
jgi:hypothetical protein